MTTTNPSLLIQTFVTQYTAIQQNLQQDFQQADSLQGTSVDINLYKNAITDYRTCLQSHVSLINNMLTQMEQEQDKEPSVIVERFSVQISQLNTNLARSRQNMQTLRGRLQPFPGNTGDSDSDT